MKSIVYCMQLLIFVLCIVVMGCISEHPYLFASRDTVVLLRGKSPIGPASIYTDRALSDSLEVSVVIRRHCDLRGRFQSASSNSALIDIMVSPEDKAKDIEYYPDSIRITAKNKSFVLHDSKERKGYEDSRSFAAVLLMPDLADVGVSPDSVWCVLDLDGVLKYRGRSLELGRIEGRLPKDWK